MILLPYHISDWLAFGLTEDVKLLCDVPLPPELEFSEYRSLCLNPLAAARYPVYPGLYD